MRKNTIEISENKKGRSYRQPETLPNPTLTVLVIGFFLLSSLPAFYSCSNINEDHTETEWSQLTDIQVSTKAANAYNSLDIFFFNDDKLRKLDSYQHYDNVNMGADVVSASRAGKRIVVAVANYAGDLDGHNSISSYDDLSKLHSELKNDNPEFPVMCGECKISAGREDQCSIHLEPLLARIVLSSISCDFHSKVYSGEYLTDVKVYLTNVSGRFPLTGTEPEQPGSILNYGRIMQADTSDFVAGNLIFKKIPSDIGASVIFSELELYCYQNTIATESLSTPFTRLVIEGKLQGETTYYPININRADWYNGQREGVEKNREYCFDITLTRRGVSDPDTAIDLSYVNCMFKIKPWTDKDNHTITY